jgi:hypothetical protein
MDNFSTLRVMLGQDGHRGAVRLLTEGGEKMQGVYQAFIKQM